VHGSPPGSTPNEALEASLRQFVADKQEGKLNDVMIPLNASLTGTEESPFHFLAMEVLGNEETLKRFDM